MKYIKKKLAIDNVRLVDIARKFDTPTYCYSYTQLKKTVNIPKLEVDKIYYNSVFDEKISAVTSNLKGEGITFSTVYPAPISLV